MSEFENLLLLKEKIIVNKISMVMMSATACLFTRTWFMHYYMPQQFSHSVGIHQWIQKSLSSLEEKIIVG